MNETIKALEDAIKILNKSFHHDVSYTGKVKVLHAQNHLEAQLAAMIAE